MSDWFTDTFTGTNVMAILLQIYGRVAAQTHRFQTVTGKGFRPRVIRLGRWRYAAGALIVAIPFVVVVVPLLTIVWAALLPYYQPFSAKALPLLGFGNFVQVLNSPSFRGAILNPLQEGTISNFHQVLRQYLDKPA